MFTLQRPAGSVEERSPTSLYALKASVFDRPSTGGVSKLICQGDTETQLLHRARAAACDLHDKEKHLKGNVCVSRLRTCAVVRLKEKSPSFRCTLLTLAP